MTLQIKTNYHFRPLLSFFGLKEKEQKELAGRHESIEESSFFRYKHRVYDLEEFMKYDDFLPFINPDGCLSYTYSSGLFIRFSPCGNAVQVFSFFS